jgi:hypothetical protein
MKEARQRVESELMVSEREAKSGRNRGRLAQVKREADGSWRREWPGLEGRLILAT